MRRELRGLPSQWFSARVVFLLNIADNKTLREVNDSVRLTVLKDGAASNCRAGILRAQANLAEDPALKGLGGSE
jgi:hypothetical protein